MEEDSVNIGTWIGVVQNIWLEILISRVVCDLVHGPDSFASLWVFCLIYWVSEIFQYSFWLRDWIFIYWRIWFSLKVSKRFETSEYNFVIWGGNCRYFSFSTFVSWEGNLWSFFPSNSVFWPLYFLIFVGIPYVWSWKIYLCFFKVSVD